MKRIFPTPFSRPAIPVLAWLSFASLASLAAAVPGPAAPGDASSAGPAGAPEKVILHFRDQAAVDGGPVRLGDLARIETENGATPAVLETLTVARSAAFGLTRLIDAGLVCERALRPFAARYAFEADRKMIRVTTRSDKYPADSLAALVGGFVAGMPAAVPGLKRTWELVRAPAEILVPRGRRTLDLAFAGSKRRGMVDLTLDIGDGTRVLRHLPLTVNIRVEEPVLVALRRIDRGEELTRENVRIETRETTGFNETVICDPGRLMGRLAKATLTPGRIVTPLMVEIPPAVRRGQESQIVYRTPSVRISAAAICRQDGMPGQIITAKNLGSGRLMRVRVTEDGMLEPIPGI